MDLHHCIGQQRIRYIIDNYRLMGSESQSTSQFESYINKLFEQYPLGLIELALVETLARNWLTVPMQKGVGFLSSAHERLQKWQTERQQATRISVTLTPSQFWHITGLDPKAAFSALSFSNLDNQPHHPDNSQSPSLPDHVLPVNAPTSAESLRVRPSR